MIKGVGYLRTSPEEIKNSDMSLQKQKKDIIDHASKHGISLDFIYEDAPVEKTGYIDCSLGGIFALVDDVLRNHNIKYVIVAEENRLKRKETDVNFHWELIRRKKKILLAGVDKPDEMPIGKQHKPIFEPPDISMKEKLLEGRVRAALSGKHQSGPSPYGYCRDYTGRRKHGVLIKPDEEESEIVRLIYHEYIKTKSLAKLTVFLEEKNIKTRRGKPWSRAGLAWILRNETYVGIVRFGRIRTKGIHKPLVKKRVFNKVQEILGRRKGKGSKT